MIALCLPGKWYSGEFLQCMDSLYRYFVENNVDWFLRQRYSANVFFSRNMLLGVDPGEEVLPDAAKPFGGREYNYVLWIDSDAIFSPMDFERLLGRGKDFIGGVARPSANEDRLNCGRLTSDGGTSHMTKALLDNAPRTDEGLIEVDYVGLHFALLKQGVLEKVGYPWFMPFNRVVGDRQYFPSEDIGFGLRARSEGVRIYVDPAVRVGHERQSVIWP